MEDHTGVALQFLTTFLATAGGATVVFLGLSKFLGNVWREQLAERSRLDSELLLEETRNRSEHLRIQPDRFAESQYDVYIKLWWTLQALNLTVETLWHKATRPNVLALAHRLRSTEEQVSNWSLFFEDEHYRELLRLLDILKQFNAGMRKVVELRTQENKQYISLDEVRKQIENNRKHKEQFKELLDKLKLTFQNKLSTIEF